MKALLVIDVQQGVIAWGGEQVHDAETLTERINTLIGRARAAGSPVVFVQHEDDWLVPGEELWELVDSLDVQPGIDRFSGKTHGSAFHDTSLEADLRALGVDELVVCGLQTELCVDSTVRHAATLGWPVTLVADAHSTFAANGLGAEQIIAHHTATLRSYARVLASDEVVF